MENSYILVVDDIPDNLKIVSTILKQKGYKLALAVDGNSALKVLSENKIDLILLDIMMPDMSGFEVCKKIKSNKQLKNIPIIFLTAIIQSEDMVEAFKVGGADYITKPFNKDELLVRVNNQLELAHSRKKLFHANKEIIEAKEKAEQAEKAQFKFLSTMSHEIRTPLNAVVGLTDVLLMEDPKPSQIENLSTLKFSAQNLLNIINDILDYNKLSSNNVFLEQIDFNIYEILKGVHYAMNNVAKEKGVDLNYSIDNDIPKIIVGDSTRLLQIINNLVNNSLKFTKTGEVSIDVKKIDKTDKKVSLRFIVKDSGIGIPKDKFETIFEEFKQTSSSITREFGGTGLGLPIVRKTLSLMGSDIKVESEINKGSQFSFELSFLIGNEKKIISKKNILKFDDSLKNKKILLVEDNKINQMVAMKFLDQWKCKTMVAENGQIALQLVLQSNFDAILMDLHMPVMNGYEATKKIRDIKEKKFQEIPIIALSASALGEIEVRAKKFGMNDFITKPFKPSELFSSLVRHIKKRK